MNALLRVDPRLKRVAAEQPYPLLFATVSGAHLYGFPSPDSDFDLRGAHVLPLEKVLGLEVRDETVEDSYLMEEPASSGGTTAGANSADSAPCLRGSGAEGFLVGGEVLEMDIVSHDVRKFFRLLLKKNGYVLEQLYSPLIIHTTPEHAELKATARGCITRHHAHHYFGFADTQWKLFMKELPRRVKPLLYAYRVLLTGIHLMRTGEVEANLTRLNAEARLSFIGDLISRKMAGAERSILDYADVAFHEQAFQRLKTELQAAYEASDLPEKPTEESGSALNALLIRLRLKYA